MKRRQARSGEEEMRSQREKRETDGHRRKRESGERKE